MASRRTTVLIALTVGLGFAALLAPTALTAVYRGNQCGNVYSGSHQYWYVDQAGSEACIDRGYVAEHRYFYMTPLAFDYAKNTHSALNEWRVYQAVEGAWRFYKSGSCLITRGYGWSNVCPQVLIQRLNGATRVLIQIQSCNYDSDIQKRHDCSGYVNSKNAVW